MYRDPDTWYASFQQLLATSNNSYWQRLLMWPIKGCRAFYPLRNHRLVWWQDVYNYSTLGRELMPFFLNKIRTAIASERILEFKVQDGWAPLCKFLNRDIPTEDFPRLHDYQQLSQNRENAKRQAVSIWLKWFKQAGMITIMLFITAAICRRRLFFAK